jgi:hypothetical protein
VSAAGKRVYLLTRDLVFRGKLGAVTGQAGGNVTRDPAASDLAIVEIGAAGWEDRVRELRGGNVPVLAFGSHVAADLLRAARDLGAEAIPNSQVERRLAELLGA